MKGKTIYIAAIRNDLTNQMQVKVFEDKSDAEQFIKDNDYLADYSEIIEDVIY